MIHFHFRFGPAIKSCLALPVILLSMFSSPAAAHEFEAGLGTELPFGLHADLQYSPSFAPSFYIRGRFTSYLEPYTDLMNSVSTSMEFYNDATGRIVSEILSSAQAYEVAVGFKPSYWNGWLIDLAYFSTEGNGQVTGATLLEALNGTVLPSGGNLYDVGGEIDSLILRGGYELKLTEAQQLKFTFGLVKPINTETTLDRETSGPIQEAILQAARRDLQTFLDDTFKNDVLIPVAAVTWTYRFLQNPK
jgi:hypothetical protein